MPIYEATRYRSNKDMMAAILGEYGSKVFAAMNQVPRAWFLEKDQLPYALVNDAIEISGYKGISSNSQPFVVAEMTARLDPRPSDTVLEIGTASGWQAAILSKLANVVTVEYIQALAHKAHARFRERNLNYIHVVVADGSRPFAAKNSFDRMLITASVPPFPYEQMKIFDMLKEGGRVVMPVGGVDGDPSKCELVVLAKIDGNMQERRRIPGYSFVPMQGVQGWGAYR